VVRTVVDRLEGFLYLPAVWKKSRTPSINEIEQGILLAVLRLRDDAYGLRIREDIERRTGRAISLSNVYATLTRLEGKGLVRSRLGDPSPCRGGRRKRLYTVQPSGKAALNANYRTLKAMAADLESLFKGA
jgi:PadR family transcriptional regulator, regulatory protein PadR